MEAVAKEFNQKIRNRMLKLILTAATLVLVLLGIVSYFMARSLLHTEITAKTQNRITLAATQMNQWLNDKRLLLAMLTEIEKTSDLPGDQSKSCLARPQRCVCAKRFGGQPGKTRSCRRRG